MEILSVTLLILGLLIFFFGGILYLVASFQVSIWWGLAVLFLPFADVVFLFVHWQEAKHSFKIMIFAFLLMLTGQFLGPASSTLIEHVKNF